MTETTNIYALVDPRNDAIRYIGKANNVNKRRYAHIKDSRVNHRSCWIKGLKNEGLRPELFIVDVVDKDNWQFWERYWISQFKAWGFDLTNRTEGGEGTEHTEETKKLMSEIKKEYYKTHVHPRKGAKASKEELERLSKMASGRIQSKETIEKRKKSILQFNLKGIIIREWNSPKDAMNELGLSNGIYHCCRGETKTCGGFKWKYKDDV